MCGKAKLITRYDLYKLVVETSGMEEAEFLSDITYTGHDGSIYTNPDAKTIKRWETGYPNNDASSLVEAIAFKGGLNSDQIMQFTEIIMGKNPGAKRSVSIAL